MKTIPGIQDTTILRSWNAILELKDKYELGEDRWLFRGQQDSSWALRSTFERAKQGGGNAPAWKYEAAILREFTRRAHHYVKDVPKPADTLEWFALMRHYGAPSRLLDCTYSFYVAAYFALQHAVPNRGPVAIWALNTNWLNSLYKTAFPGSLEARKGDFRFKDPKDFKKHFLSRRPRLFVAPVNPFRLNERLSAQQAVFLSPGDITEPFMRNLLPIGSRRSYHRVIRVLLESSVKTEALRELRRMNITAGTLFPDLGGFAVSLNDWFHFPLNFIDKDLVMALEGRFPNDHY